MSHKSNVFVDKQSIGVESRLSKVDWINILQSLLCGLLGKRGKNDGMFKGIPYNRGISSLRILCGKVVDVAQMQRSQIE